MTCAKTVVMCRITLPEDSKGHVRVFIGYNDCANPQEVCPRLPGEGYEKCKSICNQGAHAEINALNKLYEAGRKAYGARAEVWGNTYACKECQEALYAAGVDTIKVHR